MKKLIFMLSVLTFSYAHLSWMMFAGNCTSSSYGCYSPRTVTRGEVQQGFILNGIKTCEKCYDRKLDHGVEEFYSSSLLRTEQGMKKLQEMRAAAYNCPTCDKPSVQVVPQSAQEKSAAESAVVAAPITKARISRECIAISSPSMASICICSKHKPNYSSYNKQK